MMSPPVQVESRFMPLEYRLDMHDRGGGVTTAVAVINRPKAAFCCSVFLDLLGSVLT